MRSSGWTSGTTCSCGRPPTSQSAVHSHRRTMKHPDAALGSDGERRPGSRNGMQPCAVLVRCVCCAASLPRTEVCGCLNVFSRPLSLPMLCRSALVLWCL
eukprot:332674-Prymnesium_polylepis.1